MAGPNPAEQASATVPTEAQAVLHAALIQHSEEGLMVADADGVLRVINPVAARQHGSAALGVGPHEWARALRFHRLDREPLPLRDYPLYRALQGELVENARWLVHRPDGAWLTLSGTATPLVLADGSRAGALLICRDETERIALEEQLRSTLSSLQVERELARRAEAARQRVEEQAKAIADNATVGLILMDQRQHCVFMNPAAEQITGFPLEALAGRPLHDFIHHTRPDGSPYPIEECPIDRALPERRQMQGEDTFVRRDGSFYPVAFTASPLVDGAGATRGTVIELRETTREKQAHSERDRLLCDLEQAVRVRDEFLAIAGHEVRTPLTALLLNLQSLLVLPMQGADLPMAKLMSRIQRAQLNAERLQRLVDELLDVSRLVSSHMRLEPEPLDLCQLAQDVLDRLRDQALKMGAHVVLRSEGTLVGCWDRFRLEQVVSNLLTNAFKYGAGQPVELWLRKEHDAAVLSVRDHGIGIAPEDHARIFERFERAVSSRHYGGLGLGLWIARQVVEASGGTITVQSEPSHGSCFTVTLPLPAA